MTGPSSSRSRFGRYWSLAVMAAGLPFLRCDGCGSQQHFPTRDAAVEQPVETGSVGVSGSFDSCPVVVMLVSPQEITTGRPVNVSGRGSDANADAAAHLTFAWTAPSGTFVDPAASHTTFTCAAPGPVTLTLSVSDGSCTTSQTTSVFCDAVPDGGVPGGGGAGGGAGGTGAGGAGGAVMNTCPAGEPPSGGPMCPKCTADNCALGKTGTDGCCGLASVGDQLLCEALFACFVAHAETCIPAGVSGDATNCFCGTSAASGGCFAVKGTANGPCAAQVIAAAKTDSPPAIQGQFTSPPSPLGRAVNLAACRGTFCADECGFPQ